MRTPYTKRTFDEVGSRREAAVAWSRQAIEVQAATWDNGKENGNYRDYRGWDYVGVIYWDNGKENGNYRDYRGWDYIRVIYWDNGKENGNYYNG